MTQDIAKTLPESDTRCLNFKETELTLGLPGESFMEKSGVKRQFCETVELNLGRSSNGDSHDQKNCHNDESNNETSSGAKPISKAQVVGWPPVRSYRKNMMKSCKYVKVAVDGAPYLRKVDLETYGSYQELLDALDNMFTCLTICNVLKKRKLMDPANGIKYVPTYEDKDGDWMLVGDVPWKMFVESCKRLRLMKSSEAIGLVPRTSSESTLSTSC